MLETCTTLTECEAIIRRQLATLDHIGEVRLADATVTHLAGLIRALPNHNAWMDTAPATLAVLLVSAAQRTADVPDFWAGVGRLLGPVDGAAQKRMRSCFATFITRQKRTIAYAEQDSVRAIFVHAGIHAADAADFIQRIVYPYVTQNRLSSLEETAQELTRVRQITTRPKRKEPPQPVSPEPAVELPDISTASPVMQEIERLVRLEQRAVELGNFGGDLNNVDAMITVYESELDDIKTELMYSQASSRPTANRPAASPEELERAYQQVLNDYQTYLSEIAAAGGGDIEAGLRQITAWREVRDEADLLHSKLAGSVRNFPALKAAVAAQVAQQTPTSGSLDLPQDQDEEDELDAFTDDQDEAVRRVAGVAPRLGWYLLYGGTGAAKCLFDAVTVLRDALHRGTLRTELVQRLPPPVSAACHQWWQERLVRSPRLRTAEERWATPQILLNPRTLQVTLHFPPQRCYAERGDIALRVRASDTDEPAEIPVFARWRGDSLVETETVTLPLQPGTVQLVVSLRDGGHTLREWRLPFHAPSAPYLLFDDRDGQLLMQMPADDVSWLVFPDNLDILPHPTLTVLRQETLDPPWSDYQAVRLALSTHPTVNLRTPTGAIIALEPARVPRLQAQLYRTDTRDLFHRDGFPIVGAQLPALALTFDSVETIAPVLVTLTVEQSNDTYTHPLADLVPERENLDTRPTRTAIVPLASLLPPATFGPVRILLTNTPAGEWYEVVCLVPPTTVRFDTPLYLPWATPLPPTIGVQIKTAPGVTVSVRPPASLRATETGVLHVQVSQRESEIFGELHWSSQGRDYTIPLTVEIPKLYWRLSAAQPGMHDDWRQEQVHELWLEDWTTLPEQWLWIRLPESINGTLELASPEVADRREECMIERGYARFDLSAWRAALRPGKTVKELLLAHRDAPGLFKQAPIFSIRARWEAEDIVCMQAASEDRVHLQIAWNDKGRVPDRRLNLWRLTGELVAGHDLDPHSTKFLLSLDHEQLPAGDYLIELVAIDPWVMQDDRFPGVGGENTLVVQIVAPQALPRDEEVSLTTVIVDGRPHTFARPYRLRTIGQISSRHVARDLKLDDVLIKTTNLGWYLGELLPTGLPDDDREIATANPIKFPPTLLSRGMGAIEDVNGEGAMYCRQCEQLHWQQSILDDPDHARHLRGPVDRFLIHQAGHPTASTKKVAS